MFPMRSLLAKMVRCGEVRDYAEIATLMGLSRARVTQICNMLLLSPEVQARILTDANTTTGLSGRLVRRASMRPLWSQQTLSP